MYTLRLLGGFALESAAGEDAVQLPQRRAEAMLALLALAGDRGWTRDRLLAFLWPERDASHARHSLRDAIYATRSALGRDAVVSAGDRLRLDSSRITSDVQEFAAALSAGRLTDAVAAYGGPLLDGFHLSGASEFDRWVDSERARLCRECRDAMRRLAEAAEQEPDWDGAADWWARVAALDPYDSRAVVRRMHALARSGDRANAVMAGEAHCGVLRSHLGLEPDPSFLEELERIRTGGVQASGAPGSGQSVIAGQQPELAFDTGSSRDPAEPGQIVAEVSPAGSAVVVDTPARSRRRPWSRWAAALLVPAAVGVVLVMRLRSTINDLPRVVNAVKVTTALGIEASPAWSPDGRTLAFQSDRSGNWDIWVTRLGTGQAVNRTADSPVDDQSPTWSPDGQWIAFFSARDEGGYYVMPSVGGSARKVSSWPAGEMYPTPAEWSPDGTQLAYALGQREKPRIEILNVAIGSSRTLVLPLRAKNNAVADMSWSPDGRMLAYRRAISPVAANSELWMTMIASGESVQLTNGTDRDWSPTWSPDSRELYFISDRGGTPDLWSFAIGPNGRSPGPTRQLTSGFEMTYAALSPDGQRLAYTKGRTVRNVFRAPILDDRAATWADITQLTFDEANFESIDVSTDGRLLLSSNRSGNWDLFLLSGVGRELEQLTTDSAMDAGPRWRPDWSELAFYSSRTGHREIWIMPVGGGPARQLTDGESESWYPAWSPTGTEIVVEARSGLRVVSVPSGAGRRLTDGVGDSYPDWSPDGMWVAFTSRRDGPTSVWRVAASGGQPERMIEGEGRLPRWSPDGKRLYFLGQGDHGDDVWALSVESREEWPVTALTGRYGVLGRFGLAVGGRYLYFTWEQSRGDIWIADVVPSPGG